MAKLSDRSRSHNLFLVLEVHAHHYMQMSYLYASDFLFKNFCKLAKQAETTVGEFWRLLQSFVLKSLFATRSDRYLNPKHVIQRALKLPSISHTCFFRTTKLYKPLPRFEVFLARTRSPNLHTETKCRELIPEAF